jgi:hypothetical protein
MDKFKQRIIHMFHRPRSDGLYPLACQIQNCSFRHQVGPLSRGSAVREVLPVQANTTHKKTHIHAYMHAYTHTYLHSYLHTYILAYIHSCMHTYIHTCVRTLTRARTHARTHFFYIHTSLRLYWNPQPSFRSSEDRTLLHIKCSLCIDLNLVTVQTGVCDF